VTARHVSRCVALLGQTPGPVVILAPAAPRLAAALAARVPVANDGSRAGAAVVCFAGARADIAARQTALRAIDQRLVPGARLVLVDHNQPRQPWRRLLANLHLATAGLRPARARYPAARELAALGFQIERLELTSGERIQLVVARKR
jgi:hypothetical protein